MGNFREHAVRLFLDRELYLAFIKLQADKKLGRSFAGLLPFVEGLYRLGYITEEAYESHKERYSAPLVAEKLITIEETKGQKKLKKIEEQFSKFIKNWDSMKPKAKQYAILKARKYRDTVSNAELVLALRYEPVMKHG